MAGIRSFKPVVFTISLGSHWQQNLFQSTHQKLINELMLRSDMKHALTTSHMLDLFNQFPHPRAILVADPGIFDEAHAGFAMTLFNYAERGGTVVFGGVFAALIRSEKVNPYFAHLWGLPWSVSDSADRPESPRLAHEQDLMRYLTSGSGQELERNSFYVEYRFKAHIPASFRCSQHARLISGVARRHAWYLPRESDSEEPSTASDDLKVSNSSSVQDDDTDPFEMTKTPFVYSSYGFGKIGYVGDYNSDDPEPTFIITLAMLGLS
ncbi:hypothetical protein ESCO_003282 [Escovopsis weberi]|uniref:Uncharacterized protein n=1 Tax=Escovopsis weberi TaxID=150374 RepID=A0A0M9VSE7_ESCWE|nr:hypothetical protein ESCO_003282 [Escovopsis weberi]